MRATMSIAFTGSALAILLYPASFGQAIQYTQVPLDLIEGPSSREPLGSIGRLRVTPGGALVISDLVSFGFITRLYVKEATLTQFRIRLADTSFIRGQVPFPEVTPCRPGSQPGGPLLPEKPCEDQDHLFVTDERIHFSPSNLYDTKGRGFAWNIDYSTDSPTVLFQRIRWLSPGPPKVSLPGLGADYLVERFWGLFPSADRWAYGFISAADWTRSDRPIVNGIYRVDPATTRWERVFAVASDTEYSAVWRLANGEFLLLRETGSGKELIRMSADGRTSTTLLAAGRSVSGIPVKKCCELLGDPVNSQALAGFTDETDRDRALVVRPDGLKVLDVANSQESWQGLDIKGDLVLVGGPGRLVTRTIVDGFPQVSVRPAERLVVFDLSTEQQQAVGQKGHPVGSASINVFLHRYSGLAANGDVYAVATVTGAGSAGPNLYRITAPRYPELRIDSVTSPARSGEEVTVKGFWGAASGVEVLVEGERVNSTLKGADSVAFTVTGPAGTRKVRLRATLLGRRTVLSNTVTVQVTAALPTGPEISRVVHGASFLPGALAPGTFASVFGSNFGVEAPAPARAVFELGGASVDMCGVQARLFHNTGQGQINFVVPRAAEGRAECEVTVTASGQKSRPVAVRVVDQSLALFEFTPVAQGPALAIITTVQYQFIGPVLTGADYLVRAAPGEVLILWGSGGGVTSPAVEDGEAAPAAGAATRRTPVVKIGGVPAEVLYSGMAPGFLGLYQITVRVPEDTPPGDAPLWFGELPDGPVYSLAIR